MDICELCWRGSYQFSDISGILENAEYLGMEVYMLYWGHELPILFYLRVGFSSFQMASTSCSGF